MIYTYKVLKSDTLICETIYSLLFKNGKKSGCTFKYLLEKTPLRSKNVKSWVESSVREIEVRLDLANSFESQIINDYLIDERRLNRRVSNRITRTETSVVLPLVPFSALFPTQVALNIFERIKGDPDFSKLEHIVSEDPTEYHTTQGPGISEQTFHKYLDDIKQELFRIKQEKSRLDQLEISILEGENKESVTSDQETNTLNQLIAEISQKKSELINLDEELERKRTQEIKREPKMAENNIFKFQVDPPVWKRNTGIPDSIETDKYIQSLIDCKNLNLIKSDKHLIWASLNKSNRLDVYDFLSQPEKEDLDTFIKYIRTTYGGSSDTIRKELINLKQTSDESYITWFRRVIKVVYKTRKIYEVPDLRDIKDEIIKSDIRFYFLEGFKNKAVEATMRNNISQVEFSNWGKQAQIYAEALEATGHKMVNNISSGSKEDINNKIDGLESELVNFIKKLDVNKIQIKKA